MKTIMLVCAAGMSTSLLVTKMKQAAEAAGEEANIFALPVSEGVNHLDEVDVILLGPQVRFQKKQVESALADKGMNKPVDVIDMKDYGMMNGEAVYKFAKKLLGE